MRALFFLALLLPAVARAEEPAPRQTALTARVVLKVVHPDEARRDALDDVAKLGGFPVLVTDQQLVLKVPPAKLDETLAALTARGAVLEKTMERNDLTLAIAQLEAQLRSKQEIFDRLRKLLDDSDVNATLQIERDMSQLVMEMESQKGQLRVQRERAAWALIDLAFNFRERDRLVYVHSPFQWINTVDLHRFLGDF
jgi:hypothetical protein